MSEIKTKLCIEASAGSGKTYRLAQRFISLLQFLKYEKENACRLGQNSQTDIEFLKPKSIDSIAAITFTNKAAEEMKERIIEFLKNYSKLKNNNRPEENIIDEKKAAYILVEIIKNYTDFNVTTIDSFMNRILKAFSLDLNINPDYEIFFEEEKVFKYAFERLINNRENFEPLLSFLDSMLYLGEKGFNAEKIIYKNLKDYDDINLPDDVSDFESLKSAIKSKNIIASDDFQGIKREVENRISAKAQEINNIIEENSKKFNGTKIKSYLNIDTGKLDKNYTKYLALNSAYELLKKDSEIDEHSNLMFIKNLKEIVEIYKYFVILQAVYRHENILKLIRKLKLLQKDIKSYLNIVEGKEISEKISKIINEDNGVPYAFCRLGEKISHYLIDEFQDTSHEQFEAVYPLIENAVAEGGTIFTVGDKKQAVYAWRGGDYKIFDRLNDNVLMDIERIENNYRSAKEVIEFNNHIFDSDRLCKTIREVFTKKDLDIQSILNEIVEIYKSSAQKPQRNLRGYVEVMIKSKQKNDDTEEFYKKHFVEKLSGLLKHLQEKDIMVLLRKKSQIKTVVEWIKEYFPDTKIITEDAVTLINNFEIKKILLIAYSALYPDDENYIKIYNELGINEKILKFAEKSALLTPYEFFSKIIGKNAVDYENNEIYFTTFMERVLELQNRHYSLDKIIEYFYENEDIVVQLPENINAVKLMTIHKSKGLECHTVIIPFYDWNFVDENKIEIFDTISLKNVLGIDSKVLLKLDKKVRNISKEAEHKYFEQYMTNFIESLNLMYVANTRAANNLIILGSYDITQKGDYSTKTNPAMILKETFNEYFEFEDGFYRYKSGSLSLEKEEFIEETNSMMPSYKSDILKYLKIYPQSYEIRVDFEDKYIGDVFHLAMSFIGKINEGENVNELLDKAYQKAVKISGYENGTIPEMMRKTVDNLKDYFFGIDEFYNEKELIDNRGNLFRIDRIVLVNGCYYIIDYKTGEPEEEHKRQVKKYSKILPNSKAFIYYVKTGESVYV